MNLTANIFLKAAKLIDKAPTTDAECRQEDPYASKFPSGYSCDVLGDLYAVTGVKFYGSDVRDSYIELFKPEDANLGWYDNKEHRVMALLLMVEMAKTNDL